MNVTIAAALALTLFARAPMSAQSLDVAVRPPADPTLRAELLARADSDATARSQFGGGSSAGATGHAAVARIDASNTARMKDIIERHGWPGRDLVGADGSAAAWVLVQHADADPAFQDRALEALRAAVDAGQARAVLHAFLLDRLRVARHQPQRFGTQVDLASATLTPCAIEDDARVDARRAAVGLEPLAEYVRRLRALRAESEAVQLATPERGAP